MGVVEHRQRLLENIFRLRRAEQLTPRIEDLVAVRASLEEELGETVSQRSAARFLGVSHTALQRWIRSGDLELVFNRDGRTEVPIGELFKLREAVDEQRRRGNRTRRVLEPYIAEGQRRGASTDVAGLLADHEGRSGHGRAERQSLAYHRALSKRLDRPMADEALHAVWKLQGQGRMDAHYADQWERVLRSPIRDIKRTMGADTPGSRDLRQNSPFAGMLGSAERKKILAEVT